MKPTAPIIILAFMSHIDFESYASKVLSKLTINKSDHEQFKYNMN